MVAIAHIFRWQPSEMDNMEVQDFIFWVEEAQKTLEAANNART